MPASRSLLTIVSVKYRVFLRQALELNDAVTCETDSRYWPLTAEYRLECKAWGDIVGMAMLYLGHCSTKRFAR
jgi:hypothetical protein